MVTIRKTNTWTFSLTLLVGIIAATLFGGFYGNRLFGSPVQSDNAGRRRWRSGTGGAESLLLHLALGRRCGDKAPHLQDHQGRTVSEATEPACTGVTGGVRAFLGQFPPALETEDD